jgi:hypothetical protein
MLLDLTLRLGPDAMPSDAERVFDTLVLQGLLRPVNDGFWALDDVSDARLRSMARRR